MNKQNSLALAVAALDANNPAKILKKTFCKIESEGKPIKSALEVEVGDSLDIYFSDGVLKASVTEKKGEISF